MLLARTCRCSSSSGLTLLNILLSELICGNQLCCMLEAVIKCAEETSKGGLIDASNSIVSDRCEVFILLLQLPVNSDIVVCNNPLLGG